MEVEPPEPLSNPATGCSCSCAVLTQPLIGEFHPVKDESLGLGTEGTQTLSLVQNFGTGLVSDEKN